MMKDYLFVSKFLNLEDADIFMPDNWTPTAKTFQQLFSCAPDRQLTIPRYQREYEWNNQDIELILSDLLEHSEFQYNRPLDDRVSYFL